MPGQKPAPHGDVALLVAAGDVGKGQGGGRRTVFPVKALQQPKGTSPLFVEFQPVLEGEAEPTETERNAPHESVRDRIGDMVEVQDTTSEDYHVDTYSQSQWTFRAPDGLPVRMEDKWFRGDMAYGREMSISWDWEVTNDETISAAISGWEAPEWAKAPAPKDPAVEGGGDEDWYAETLAALPAVGSAAPEISGKLLDGQSASLSDYLGQVVYLDFWYIGCGPCMRAMPHLDHMQKEFGPEGFTVLGVNHHQKPEMVERYLARRELDIPQLMVDSLPEGYPVKAYPTWMVIDREGGVVACDMGYGEGADVTLDSLVRVTL